MGSLLVRQAPELGQPELGCAGDRLSQAWFKLRFLSTQRYIPLQNGAVRPFKRLPPARPPAPIECARTHVRTHA